MRFTDADFDFNTVAVSEEEYYTFLDSLLTHPAVTDLSHSLVLNSITLNVDLTQLTEYTPPDNTHLREFKVTKDPEPTLEISLKTQPLFADKNDRYYSGTYTDEAIAFFKTQLDLFDFVTTSEIISTTDSHYGVHAEVDDLTSTIRLDDLQTYLGFTITNIHLTDQHTISELTFEFDSTREFTPETNKEIRTEKQRRDATEQIRNRTTTLPCGHTGTLNTRFFSVPNSIEQSPTEHIDGIECKRVPYIETGFMIHTSEKPSQTDTNATKTETNWTYDCTECGTAYVPVSQSHLYKKYATIPETLQVSQPIPNTSTAYTFTIYPEPFKTI